MTTAIAKQQNGNPSVSFGNVVDDIFQNSLRHFFDDHFLNTGFPTNTTSIPVNVRELENQSWTRNEFVLRFFNRSFMLDDTVDLNNIQATYDNGILRLSLQKSEKAKKLYRTIEVK